MKIKVNKNEDEKKNEENDEDTETHPKEDMARREETEDWYYCTRAIILKQEEDKIYCICNIT